MNRYWCIHTHAWMLSLSCVQLFVTPWTVAHQAPLSLEFSRQGYWNRLPFPLPGDRPNPETESTCLAPLALAGRFFINCATWEAIYIQWTGKKKKINFSNKSEIKVTLSRRRQWHPTPVLLPGKFQGQRSLVGCSPWGR